MYKLAEDAYFLKELDFLKLITVERATTFLPMMVNGSSVDNGALLDDETVRHLLGDMKQRFPGIRDQIILEVIFENHGQHEEIIQGLSLHGGFQSYPPRPHSASVYQPNLVHPPYDRSSSDITGLSDMRISPLQRPINQDINRSSILLHMKMQQESFERMREKVRALRKDAARIKAEINREEEELDSRSKVQKNPTEKDVEKLRREIKVLTKEVQEANNICDNSNQGGINSSPAATSHSPTVPGHFHDTRSPPILNNPTGNLNFHPPFSGPRFPIPQRVILHGVNASDECQARNDDQINRPTSIEDNLSNSGVWRCPACTYDNHPDIQNCEMCDTERGNHAMNLKYGDASL